MAFVVFRCVTSPVGSTRRTIISKYLQKIPMKPLTFTGMHIILTMLIILYSVNILVFRGYIMANDNADKHSIKTERVKTYFVEAAKEIILREGVEGVSVRKVADLAGYSYATIYNYFTDLNALLLDVKASMIRDMIAYMGSVQSEGACDIDEIKRLNRRYAGYYLEHPHVFRFFYSYRLNGEMSAEDQQSFGYAQRWHDTYKGLVQNGTLREADVEIAARSIIYALHGALALYFSGNGLTMEILYDEVDNFTEYILQRRQPT